jgi:hypothetical protein
MSHLKSYVSGFLASFVCLISHDRLDLGISGCGRISRIIRTEVIKRSVAITIVFAVVLEAGSPPPCCVLGHQKVLLIQY